MNWKSSILWLLLLIGVVTAGDYVVDSTAANQVKFYAKATLGSFTGTTERISGTVRWNPEEKPASNRVFLQVDLASIDTGVGKRNKHMREKYLETNQYPLAEFDGIVVPDSTIDSARTQVRVEGTLRIHNVGRPISVLAKMTRQGDLIRVRTAFPLNIRDYAIKKPRFLLISMNELVRLQLDFYLRPDLPLE